MADRYDKFDEVQAMKRRSEDVQEVGRFSVRDGDDMAPRPLPQPIAHDLTDRLHNDGLKFIAMCTERINEHESALEFWTNERTIVRMFLADNQLDPQPKEKGPNR